MTRKVEPESRLVENHSSTVCNCDAVKRMSNWVAQFGGKLLCKTMVWFCHVLLFGTQCPYHWMTRWVRRCIPEQRTAERGEKCRCWTAAVATVIHSRCQGRGETDECAETSRSNTNHRGTECHRRAAANASKMMTRAVGKMITQTILSSHRLIRELVCEFLPG